MALIRHSRVFLTYFLLMPIVIPFLLVDSSAVEINVTCDAGTFVGKVEIVKMYGKTVEVDQFLGIPYASAPIGNLRFMKPVRMEPIQTPYDATTPGAACLDLDVLVTGQLNGSNNQVKSEDCLFLNIFVPHNKPYYEQLPVIVFIHEQGGNVGPDVQGIGDMMMQFEEVVVVQVNYRLNIWGFSSTGDDIVPGNMGLWDQHLAIEWVHNNIAEFGGDPDLVTLLGYDEGAANVFYQAMYPDNAGLFRKIILSYGGMRCPWGFNKKPQVTMQMVGKAVGCYNSTSRDLIQCMQSKTTEEVVTGIWNHRICTQFSYETITNVDGMFLTYPPYELLNPFSEFGLKERHSLSTFEVLTDSYQGGNVRLVKVLKKPNAMVSLMHKSSDKVHDRNDVSKAEETMHNEMNAEEYKVINNTVTLTKDDVKFNNPAWELARVMFGLDFTEKSMKQLKHDFNETCSKSVQSLGCFLFSLAAGGPTWHEHRTCVLINDILATVAQYEVYGFDVENEVKVRERPNIHPVKNIFIYEKTPPLAESWILLDGNSSDVESELQTAMMLWSSFAKAGTLSTLARTNLQDPCNKTSGLTGYQRDVCRDHPFAATVIGAGVGLSLNECQYQFRNRRWGCSVNLTYTDSVLEYQYHTATREAAVWTALNSAGIAYAITQACSLGTLKECDCDETKRDSVMESGGEPENIHVLWRGCSADIRYGLKFSRKFLEPSKSVDETRSLMVKHNNNAGRKVIKDNMVHECRCHGPTGSCALRTCWTRLPSFRVIGNHLLRQYDQSKKVVTRRTIKPPQQTSLVIESSMAPDKKPSKRSLVYVETSPNYCDYNAMFGTLGTVGRICNESSLGTDSCSVMCCGRGFESRQYTRVEKCNCRFLWCCALLCETCNETVFEDTCK